jgi:hypothetical protein
MNIQHENALLHNIYNAYQENYLSKIKIILFFMLINVYIIILFNHIEI